MSLSLHTVKDTTTTKSKKSKKLIEKEVNKKIKQKSLDSQYELFYDYSVDPIYHSSMPSKNIKPNLDLISKLPKVSLKSNIESDIEDSAEQTNNNDTITTDIDIENLVKEKIGDNFYYFDYEMGIIYNLNYQPIGHIDDDGEYFFE